FYTYIKIFYRKGIGSLGRRKAVIEENYRCLLMFIRTIKIFRIQYSDFSERSACIEQKRSSDKT
ncbi:hypothetical protein, partial [Listeria ilorinensis]|uniref:hypothetical protein n=1 Tax=Listeria ilorinensis TaxID=2867439 RepID=UPI001EF64514